MQSPLDNKIDQFKEGDKIMVITGRWMGKSGIIVAICPNRIRVLFKSKINVVLAVTSVIKFPGIQEICYYIQEIELNGDGNVEIEKILKCST